MILELLEFYWTLQESQKLNQEYDTNFQVDSERRTWGVDHHIHNINNLTLLNIDYWLKSR